MTKSVERPEDGFQKGFTILEMVVALTILSALMIPLLTLQNQLLGNFVRYESAYHRMTLTRNALAILDEVNPARASSGRYVVGENAILEWTAVPLSDPHPNAAGDGTTGPYTAQLFRIDARISEAEGAIITNFSFQALGWEKRT